MRVPEIPPVLPHTRAGFRLANDALLRAAHFEHLDDLSLNPAATNAPVQRGVPRWLEAAIDCLRKALRAAPAYKRMSHLIDRVVHSSGVGGEVPRHCAGTEQCLTRFFSEMGMHELTWLIHQPKSKDSGTEK
jgi:hypothetical protein